MAARKKKVAKKKTPGKAVVSWKDKLAALAEQESDRQTTIGGGGAQIKLSKGQFKFQGEDLGEAMEIVVVDFVKQKNWYDRPFDEDNPSPPACFAISPDGKNMIPNDSSPEAQADECADCWANEFETDSRGKGKACKDTYLLACIAANQMGDAEPDLAYLKVPPTSLKSWDSFMVKRNQVLNLPALAFIIEVTFDEEVDYQKIFFEEIGRVPDKAYETLFELRDVAHEVLMTPPDVTGYEPPSAKKKKSKKKATKKKSKKKTAKKKAKKKSRFS